MNNKNLSRIFGVIWICTSLLWAGLGVAGIVYGSNMLSATKENIDDSLTLIVDSLVSVHGLVDGATEIVSSTHQSLLTVQVSASSASQTLADLRPLLWTTAKVAALDVPDALDSMQESMPSLIETAKSIDETLTWLSDFEFTIPNPFGRDWVYDLGISYNPEIPLDQALEGLSRNMEEVPDDLRDLDDSLSTVDANLIMVSGDLDQLAGDIDIMGQQIQELVPHLEGLAENIEDIQETFQKTQESLQKSFDIANRILVVILVLLIVTQIPSLYMGGLLVTGTLFRDRQS